MAGLRPSLADLRFELLIDPALPPLVSGAVSFETGASPAEVADPQNSAYEHHGEGYSRASPGALTRLYEDLLYGVPLPLAFATRGVRGVDTIVAAAIFLDRELILRPGTFGLVAATDFMHRHGVTMAGHVDPDLCRFFGLLLDYVVVEGLGRSEVGQRLRDAIGWIGDFVLGAGPHLGDPLPESKIVEVGSGGFVVAETAVPTELTWVNLYRLGFLKGVAFGFELGGRRRVLVSRKSAYVPFDLQKAMGLLNDLESHHGHDPGWLVEGEFLKGPLEGTRLSPAHVVAALVRC